MSSLKTLIFLVAFAHAGWFKSFCAHYIIGDDPHDVPDYLMSIEMPVDEAVRIYREQGGLCYWNRNHSRIQLRGYGAYLRSKPRTEEIERALQDYEFLEKEEVE